MLGRAGDGTRELLPWTAGPGAQKNFDPEHPLAGDVRDSAAAAAARLGVRDLKNKHSTHRANSPQVFG
jgi:hypothetical protein